MVNDFVLTNPDFFVSGDPHSLWKELRATDPVHWTERRDRSGFWSITTYADAQLVYRDPASFSSEGGVTLGANETSDPSEPQVDPGSAR